MATMNKIQVWVTVDGQQVLAGERKTPRVYDWAVVVFGVDRKPNGLVVASYHRSMALAQKALSADTWQIRRWKGATAEVRQTLVVPMATRDRVRCEGLNRKTWVSDGVTFAREARCLKDAGDGGTQRCAEHAAQDVVAFRAAIDLERDAANAAIMAKWDARHAEAYTAETCPVHNGCRVHPKN